MERGSFQQFLEDALDDDSDGSFTRNLRNRQQTANTKETRTMDTVAEKRIRKLVEGAKFLSDFDPEKSIRERRKLTRKCYTQTTTSRNNNLFDEKGRYRTSSADVCDCLDNACPGCHFPCPNCKSAKCGSNCRVNRKWAFESIEHDGKDLVIKNMNI